MNNEIIIKGKKYSSIQEFCNVKRLKYNTIYRQLKRYNYPITAESIEKYIDGKIKNSVTILGVKYNSLKDFAKKNNINYSSFLNTLKHIKLPFTDKNIQKYLNGEFKQGRGVATKLKINGIEYTSIRDFCKKTNTKYITVLKAIQKGTINKTSKSIEQWYNKRQQKTEK